MQYPAWEISGNGEERKVGRKRDDTVRSIKHGVTLKIRNGRTRKFRV